MNTKGNVYNSLSPKMTGYPALLLDYYTNFHLQSINSSPIVRTPMHSTFKLSSVNGKTDPFQKRLNTFTRGTTLWGQQ